MKDAELKEMDVFSCVLKGIVILSEHFVKSI